MKNTYIAPEVKIVSLSADDIIQTSSAPMNTTINGVEAYALDSTDVNLFNY